MKYLQLKLAITLLLLTNLYTYVSAKSFLWEASSQTAVVYIQGSIDLLTPHNYPMPHDTINAFADSQVLILETDIAKSVTIIGKEMIIKEAKLPSGTKLRDSLSSDTYMDFQEIALDSGLPKMYRNQYKPWMTSIALRSYELKKHGFFHKNNLPLYFYTKALEIKKPVRPFSSLSAQLNEQNYISGKYGNQLIDWTIQEVKRLPENKDKIINSWMSGDVDTYNKYLKESFKDFPNLYTYLIKQRNDSWIALIEKLLATNKRYMVILNASHLVDESGVINQLTKKRYFMKQY